MANRNYGGGPGYGGGQQQMNDYPPQRGSNLQSPRGRESYGCPSNGGPGGYRGHPQESSHEDNYGGQPGYDRDQGRHSSSSQQGKQQQASADYSDHEVDEIICKIREVCKKRSGTTGFKDLARTFRLYDSDRSNNLDREEVDLGLKKYGVHLNAAELKIIFAAFDVDRNGTVNLSELLRCIKPPMSKSREDLVKKAFKKMDCTGDGVINAEDLKRSFDVNSHPKFKSGEWTKTQVFNEFMKTFEGPTGNDRGDGKVTFEEFMDYYVGVSANIDKDVYFDYMMRQSWKIQAFRLYDNDGSRDLDKEELGVGLSKYGVQLMEEELDTIFAAFDRDGSGTVDLTELVQSIKPPMSNARVALIEKAFRKMDKTGDGVITQADVKGVYNVKDHPKFKTGQWTEEQCFQEFLNSFQENSETKDEKVTWQEFLDYYNGVSAQIDKEVYFDYMMRQTWKM